MTDPSSRPESAPGLLAAWLKVPAAAEQEFNDWYDSEHLRQIASTPGFRNGRRYRSLDSDWYAAFYDLERAEVGFQHPFRLTIANPTPWSQRMARLYGNNRVRNICTQLCTFGGDRAEAAPFLFIAQMNVAPEAEEAFNDWYDHEHAPALAEVPGCLRVRRFETLEGHPRYLTIYDLVSPEVLETQQWHEAREAGRTAQMRRRMLDVSKGTYAFLNEFQSPYVAASKAP